MRIPNIYIALGTTTTLDLGDYVSSDVATASVGNEAIATVALQGNSLTIEAKSTGQTALTVACADGSNHHATITVREGANDNGWL